jgi:hypothetical protein
MQKSWFVKALPINFSQDLRDIQQKTLDNLIQETIEINNEHK